MKSKINLLIIFVLYLTKVERQSKATIIPYNNPIYTNNLSPPLQQLKLDFEPNFFDYWVKLLPNQKNEPEGSIKKVSPTQLSTVNIVQTLELNKTDLVQCEIINPITERKPIIIIHTSSTTSESPDVTKFSNPTKENCFSFRVMTKGVAEIYLYSDLLTFKHVVVTLGINNNTESYMRDIHGTCEDCKPKKTYNILDSYEYKGFWIELNKGTITVGREDQTEKLLSNTFYNDFDEIRFIGLSTSGNVEHGSWRIMDPFCPSTLKKTNKERSYVTKCHKIFDKTALRLSDLSVETKLLKKVEALEDEFNTEKIETKISKTKIKEYYMTNLHELYIEEYVDLQRKCRKRNCANMEKIRLKINNFENILKNKIKEVIENPNCSPNGIYDEILDNCICKKGFAGNGYYCEKDTDGDRFPDKNIKECSGKLECQKDNCISIFNSDQADWNSDGVGDVCEHEILNNDKNNNNNNFYKYNIFNDNNIVSEQISDEYASEEEILLNDASEMNCAKFTVPDLKIGQKCLLATDFFVPFNFNETKIEILFTQMNSKKLYKLTWDNKENPRFKLNILKDLNEKADDFESNIIKKTNALWINKKPRIFEPARNYRLFINYSSNKLQLRISDFRGDIIDSTSLTISDWKEGIAIGKVCSTSATIEWFGGVAHHCK